MQKTLRAVLEEQAMRHTSMQPQDVIKLCYQAAFGAEHLLTELRAAADYFEQEYEETKGQEDILYEPIASDVFRVNLGAWKKAGFPKEWLFQMFLQMKSQKGSQEEFLNDIEQAGWAVKDGVFAFSFEEWETYRNNYMAEGIYPVHHSREYREKEHPAYRLVSIENIQILPVLKCLNEIKQEPHGKVIAIDGRCASGKTTLAERLAGIIGAGVVHMDDFFLPTFLRTRQRMEQPGGNIHYERFIEEVIPYLRKRESFSYQTFECSTMEMKGTREISASVWRIIEGAYSCHPKLGTYMDRKIFIDVDPCRQLERIRARNGEQGLEKFRSLWIPMEENYFKKFEVREQADLILASD